MVQSAQRATSQWLSARARTTGTPGKLAIALPLLSGALLVAQAFILAGALGEAIVHGRSLPDLLPAIGLFATIVTLRLLLNGAAEIFAVDSAEAVKQQLRGSLVTDLISRAPSWTAARSSGALSSLMVEQVDALDGYFVRYLPALVQAAVLPLAFAAVAFTSDWFVGLLFLVTAPLIPVFMALAGLGAEAASRSQAGALSRLSGRFADRLRGLTTLKLLGRETAEISAVRNASEELRIRTMRVMRIAFLSSAVLEFFAALGVAGVALYIGLSLLDLVRLPWTALSLTTGLFCLLMAPEVYQPLRLLAASYHDRASAKAALAEMATQLGTLPALTQPKVDTPPVPQRHGAARLALSEIVVASPGGRSVITGGNLVLEAGERIALLGPSGSGKSTIIEAIARLRTFEGHITLDGTDLRDLPEPELRQLMAVLSQRPRVFAGTIADNIRLGRRDACHGSVRLAAQRACVTDFADGLPQGLATPIGENGFGLSGGEIQRIALARLYLRDPTLLLLDEPTAHLDAATEAKVIDGLLDFAKGRTLLVATHSTKVARRMDRAFRIVNGQLLPSPQLQLATAPQGAA